MAQVPTKRIIVTVFSPDGARVTIGDTDRDVQLSISFGCTMTTKPQRNGGTVTITNLSETSRNALSKATNTDLGLFERGDLIGVTSSGVNSKQLEATLVNGQAYCTIDAGEDDVVGRVFEGSVESLVSKQNGPDWVTEIQIADSQSTAGVGIFRSWQAKTQLFTVVRALVREMGLEDGNLTSREVLNAAVGANVKSVFARPYQANGSVDSILTQIFTLTGTDYWIDRGAFYVVRRGQPLDDRVLVLTNEEGGLRTAPEQLDRSAIAISTDFIRGLRIGRKVVIQLGGIQTEYRADQVSHGLDNREGDFASAALLRLIPKVR